LDPTRISAEQSYPWQSKDLVQVLGDAHGRQWTPVLSVAVSPVGGLAASGGGDGFISLWDLKTGDPRGRFRAHNFAVGGLAFTPDGKQIVSGGVEGLVRLWDVTTLEDLGGFQGPPQPGLP